MIFSYHYGSALRDPEPERIVLIQERVQKCFDANKICIQNMHFCIFTGAGVLEKKGKWNQQQSHNDGHFIFLFCGKIRRNNCERKQVNIYV